MLNYIIERSGGFFSSSDSKQKIHAELPPALYQVNLSNSGEYFLTMLDEFTLPKKLYGNSLSHTTRIMKTFNERAGSTGVLLTGTKGSGKTLLAKNLALTMLQQGYATLVVSTSCTGPDFNSFIQSITTPVAIIFDEFEKVYHDQSQEGLLTLLDGIYNTKKLFILTSNESRSINRNMLNRPSRLYYMLEFTGLEQNFVVEYCNDHLKQKEHLNAILLISATHDNFNFDMLQVLVEECNRFDEHPNEAIKMLNINYDAAPASRYKITVTNALTGIEIKCGTEFLRGNPLAREAFNIDVDNPCYDSSIDVLDDSLEANAYFTIHLEQKDLVKFDPLAQIFTYEYDLNDDPTQTKVTLPKLSIQFVKVPATKAYTSFSIPDIDLE